MSETVLVVDKEELIRWSLRRHFESLGYSVVEAESGSVARDTFDKGVDVVLLDVRLPDAQGTALLQALRNADSAVPVILMTAHSTVEGAVVAMQEGAFNYLRKPFNLDDVAREVARALGHTKLARSSRTLRQRSIGDLLGSIVGDSPAMRQVKGLIAKVAESPASTVLLSGESGTGKDVVAHAIHDSSQRAAGPFVNITCSALTETLLASELFGHERGAFTDARAQKRGLLEQADGGTVFLDEISETSPAFQAKLLRFLEDKAFRRVGGAKDIRPNVRVVAATNRDLEEAVAQGKFRADLFYRLAVFRIELPPLRERGDDITALAAALVDKLNTSLHKRIRGISPAALDLLCSHTWPGNVRELRNALERAMLVADGHDTLEGSHFAGISGRQAARQGFKLPASGVNFAELERNLVLQALEVSRGNQTRAARLLGMNRDQIRYRINKFRLGRPAEDQPFLRSTERPSRGAADAPGRTGS
jgi:DNA-binding NtrC family response regulator